MIRFAKIGFVIVVLAGGLLVALPQLLSTATVKQRIEVQLSELAGRPVQLKGRSSVSLQPYLGVTYDDVTVGQITQDAKAPLISVEKLQAKLELSSIVFGRMRLSEMTLVRPQFNLEIDRSGQPNWGLQQGLIADQLDLSGDQPIQNVPLGSVTIMDGSLKLDDAVQRTTQTITAINGTILWPDIRSSAEAQLNGVWRGDVVNVNFRADNLFELLKGGESPSRLSLKSEALTTVFDGIVNTVAGTAMGSFSAVSPSVKRLSSWMRVPSAFSQIASELALSGDVTASGSTLELADARITLGENEATGRLQIAKEPDQTLAVNGTLALEEFTLGSVAQDDTDADTDGPPDLTFDPGILENLKMDLRLSTPVAKIGPFDLSNIAAAILIRKQRASIDIGNAEMLGGTLSGTVIAVPQDDAATLAIEVALADIDLAGLSGSGTSGSISLSGKGDIYSKIKTLSGNTRTMLSNMSGEARVVSQAGSLKGIDLAGIYEAATVGSKGIAEFLSGETSYEALEFGVFIADGTAFLRNSKFVADNLSINFVGRSELAQRSLALRGEIVATEVQNEQQLPPLPFFVGGTTGSPLLVPLPDGRGPKNETANGATSSDQ